MSTDKQAHVHWSPVDERQFQEMTARRKLFHSTKRAAVVQAWNDAYPMHEQQRLGAVIETNIINALIEHADAFRDALAPFDSGVRPANASDK